jgi:hypothetical protein
MKSISLFAIALFLSAASTVVPRAYVPTLTKMPISRNQNVQVGSHQRRTEDRRPARQAGQASTRSLLRKASPRPGTDTADLYIGYQAGIGTEKQFTSYDTGWDYGPGWYRGCWYGGGGGMTTGQTSTIYIGKLKPSLISRRRTGKSCREAIEELSASEEINIPVG